VSLHTSSHSPAPLSVIFSEHLEDLVSGGPPRNDVEERAKVRRAVDATLKELKAGEGVVVHCWGGRGRTGTVLGCVLRELGYSAKDAISFLDGVHKARGKPGWPESPWQSCLVEEWRTDG
jgi:protein-tyrosine phosphatase